jgi:hypothetical protein
MRIDAEEVTVVIQGPIDWSIDPAYARPTTLMLTRNVRRLMPSAKIVLSTWRNQNVEGLSFDKLVFSEDPGPQGVWPSFTPNNVNRQIVSTTAGLDEVSTKYVLKIRTDIILQSTAFMQEFACLYPIANDERAIFKRPVVANNLTSRNSRAVLERIGDNPLPLHPSDHVHFGLLEDLRCLWDVPLQKEEDAFYFMDRVQPNRWRSQELSRLAPEQHILSHAINKYRPLILKDYGDKSSELLDESDYYMGTHFHFIRDDQFSISFRKYHTDHHSQFEWMRHNHGSTQHKPESFVGRRLSKLKSIFKLP